MNFGRWREDAMVMLEIDMWQSQIEIDYYSVVYFERIAKFDML